MIGVALGKIDSRDDGRRRGYVAMLVVHKDFRGLSIGTQLVKRLLSSVLQEGVSEVIKISTHKIS